MLPGGGGGWGEQGHPKTPPQGKCKTRGGSGPPRRDSWIFEIQDLSPLAVASGPLREDQRSSKLEIHFLWTRSFVSAARAYQKHFKFLGVGVAGAWWCVV